MECPNGWLCNEDCAHYLGIDQCDYVEEVVDLKEIAATIEKGVTKVAIESAKKIKANSDPQRLIGANSANFWGWWGESSPPDALIQKEPINSMSGSINFGGGSSVKRKKSKKGNKPTVYVWGETL